MVMDCASAELCRYAANAMLATRISFMNEVANVCERVGANVDHVRRGDRVRSADWAGVPVPRRRLRRQLLPEGRQGHRQVLERRRATTSCTLQAVEAVNERRRASSWTGCAGTWRCSAGRTIAVWGLAFKPRTDDMRGGAGHRPDRAAAGGGREGAGLRSRGAGRGPAGLRTAGLLSPSPATRRWRAPTRWRSSPSGTSSASPTSRG